MDECTYIKKRFDLLVAIVDERVRRLLVAAEAECLGYGGISVVSRETGVSRRAIAEGIKELRQPENLPIGRVRIEGAGRKKTIEKDPTLKKDLELLIEPAISGDPESPLKWTCKSVRKLTDELQKMGHRTNRTMVAEFLHEMGYSLQANKKTIEGTSHPDRNAQFEHINSKA